MLVLSSQVKGSLDIIFVLLFFISVFAFQIDYESLISFVERFNLNLSKVDDVTGDLVDVKETVVGFENDLVVLTEEVTAVKESFDILDNSVDELNDNFEQLTEELDDIIGHDNSTDTELDELKEQVADLATDLNNLDEIGLDFILFKFKLSRT